MDIMPTTRACSRHDNADIAFQLVQRFIHLMGNDIRLDTDSRRSEREFILASLKAFVSPKQGTSGANGPVLLPILAP